MINATTLKNLGCNYITFSSRVFQLFCMLLWGKDLDRDDIKMLHLWLYMDMFCDSSLFLFFVFLKKKYKIIWPDLVSISIIFDCTKNSSLNQPYTRARCWFSFKFKYYKLLSPCQDLNTVLPRTEYMKQMTYQCATVLLCEFFTICK